MSVYLFHKNQKFACYHKGPQYKLALMAHLNRQTQLKPLWPSLESYFGHTHSQWT